MWPRRNGAAFDHGVVEFDVATPRNLKMIVVVGVEARFRTANCQAG
jgi:hypothetical protein